MYSKESFTLEFKRHSDAYCAQRIDKVLNNLVRAFEDLQIDL